jgi:hypothetical protein
MRQFTGQRGLSLFVNFGHRLFATLLNAVLLERMRDPFTMFKVFRRDCLYGLEFECNRFDFDFELLIKLIRKGYRPVELPVNYRSRSFAEGKKVRLFRDPLTWLKAFVRLRFVKIDPMSVAERSARPASAPASTATCAPLATRSVIAISGGPWNSSALPPLQPEGGGLEIRRGSAPQPAREAEQPEQPLRVSTLEIKPVDLSRTPHSAPAEP